MNPRRRTTPKVSLARIPYASIMASAMKRSILWWPHGKHGAIQDRKCQSYVKKITVRRNTVMYRLKQFPDTVAKVLGLLALGLEISALKEVFKVHTKMCAWGNLKTFPQRTAPHLHHLRQKIRRLADFTPIYRGLIGFQPHV